MKALYDVPAPAKLNLFLHIVGRRADGYHLLQSAFVLIDWCDTLHFELRPDGLISREDLGMTLPAQDLIVRAATALQHATGTRQGVHVCVDKHIPAQAGMGGGSSDAASTLLALNRLWNLSLNTVQLATIGLTLGADVPFFLLGKNAWVEGVGEQLTPIEIPVTRFVVVKPPGGIPTEKIFSSPILERNSETAIISGFVADPVGFGRNDLQNVAQALCPGVTQALEWLKLRGFSGRMTGSGSAVFAKFQQNMLHSQKLDNAPDGFQVRLCGSLKAHPLYGWADSNGLSVDCI